MTQFRNLLVNKNCIRRGEAEFWNIFELPDVFPCYVNKTLCIKFITILFFVLTVLCLTCLYVSFNVFVFIRIIWFVQLFTSAWCLMKLLIHVHSECLILESNADFKQQCSVNSSCSTFINPDSFVFNINVFVSYMFLKYLKLSPECCLLG